MITAQQAREKAISKRKNLEDLLATVGYCAEAGKNAACFTTKDINVTDEMKNQLIELGYNLEVDDKYFLITW